jgi:hypothetical protein
MIPEAEHKATPELLRSIPKERILSKFSRPGCERPSRRGESSLVTKTGHPSWVFCGGRGR